MAKQVRLMVSRLKLPEVTSCRINDVWCLTILKIAIVQPVWIDYIENVKCVIVVLYFEKKIQKQKQSIEYSAIVVSIIRPCSNDLKICTSVHNKVYTHYIDTQVDVIICNMGSWVTHQKNYFLISMSKDA